MEQADTHTHHSSFSHRTADPHITLVAHTVLQTSTEQSVPNGAYRRKQDSRPSQARTSTQCSRPLLNTTGSCAGASHTRLWTPPSQSISCASHQPPNTLQTMLYIFVE